MINTLWIRKFGTYDFYNVITSVQDSSVSALDSLSTFPDVSGALDNYGSNESPKPPATITVGVIISANDAASLQYQLDAFDKAMRSGRQRLWYAPFGSTNKTADWRWAWAKAVQVTRPRAIDDHLMLTRQVTFSLFDPYWYNNSNIWYLDDGNLLDAGLTFGGNASQTVSNGSTITVTNSGDAPVLPVITVEYGTGTVANFNIQRLDASGNVLEQWTWTGTLNASERLIVDCAAYKITYDSVGGMISGYSNFTPGTGQRPFMKLDSGVNTFQISGTFGGNGKVTFDYFNGWH